MSIADSACNTQDKAAAMPSQNIRHDIDPTLVQAQVASKLQGIERCGLAAVENAKMLQARYKADLANGRTRQWARPPTSVEQMEGIYKDIAHTESTVYAKVRIIELPRSGKRFILVYGDADDKAVEQGTGPFATLEEASGWFLRGGR